VYSTVIAARVGDPFLGEAVDSSFTQTLPPSRVEVVTDAGQSIPDEWRSRILDAHPKVSFHVQQGSGLASALSEGTRRVRTPYVAYLDSDDVWFPDKQQRQVQLLEQEEALDAATCRAVNVTLGQEIQEVSGSSSCTFTATTFRTGIFARFGDPDPSAGHHIWLYRWWAQARSQGIETREVDYLGLKRRIHCNNSWVTEHDAAHRALLTELRRITHVRRGGDE